MHYLKNKIYQSYSSDKQHKYGQIVTERDLILWGKHTFKRIKNILSENKHISVLDIGTGTGNILLLLFNNGYTNLTGIDISLEQIEIAKKILPMANLYHADLSEFLKGKENQFDLITGFDIIEHFTKQEAFEILILAYTALKEGGRIILQTPNAYSPWMGSVCYGDLTHEWFYTANSLDDLLIQCGFHKFQSFEVAPVAIGIKGLIRSILWKMMRLQYKVCNSLEIGSSAKNQIYSRVFIGTAIKK